MKKPNDHSTSIQLLKDVIKQFNMDREWARYHNPKNLAMSIAIEASELMEVFQWLSPTSSLRVNTVQDPAREELADVTIYCLTLAMALDIDVTSAIMDKIESNKLKYPVSQYKGTYRRPKAGGEY